MQAINVHATIALLLMASLVSAQPKQCGDDYCPKVPGLMTPRDLDSLPKQEPDARVAYGPDANQFFELRVPRQDGMHPVVVLVHGGCFKTYGSVADLAPMGDRLKSEGIASVNVEYRRLDQRGGGWPNTYLDVAQAVDTLRRIAPDYRLDLDRIVLVGHSAGGHLAMWAAGRSRVPAGSPLFVANPLSVRGVVDLAGPLDLTANIQGYESLCRDNVISKLMQGSPRSVPQHYAQASPMSLLPLRVRQVLVIGEHEDFVPRVQAEKYVRAATRAGDNVTLLRIPGAGHFEIASPFASSWPKVNAAIKSLFDAAPQTDLLIPGKPTASPP